MRMDIALHFRETVPKFAGMKGTVSSCFDQALFQASNPAARDVHDEQGEVFNHILLYSLFQGSEGHGCEGKQERIAPDNRDRY